MSHTPQVATDITTYDPGCHPRTVYETIQAPNHGVSLLRLVYSFPYDYSTFVTDDGWGVTVYECW